jgi:hypothetical protein
LPETRESLGKYQDFPRLKSNFPCPKTNFPQWLSGFCQRLSAFLNSFPLSSTAFLFSSTAFHFPRNPRKSIYGGKYQKARLHFPIGKIGNSYFTYYFFKKKIGTPYFWK